MDQSERTQSPYTCTKSSRVRARCNKQLRFLGHKTPSITLTQPTMRSAVLLLALAGLFAVHAVEVEEEGGVLIVTTENFKQVVEENEFVLMEFCKQVVRTECST